LKSSDFDVQEQPDPPYDFTSSKIKLGGDLLI